MTREEAKHRLLDIERCTPIHTREDVRDFEALEMAISALTLKSPCSLCRYRNEDTGLCDMCPAMPFERGLSQEPTVDVLEQIRAEIEQIEGVEYEVSDNQGKRYKYETIEKAEALQIIDKYTK